MKIHALIIGGGIGGLGTACLLAKKGYAVTVVEKNEAVGGVASQFQAEGFTFDMGPSWYLMPDVFENFFDLLQSKIPTLSPGAQVLIRSRKYFWRIKPAVPLSNLEHENPRTHYRRRHRRVRHRLSAR